MNSHEERRCRNCLNPIVRNRESRKVTWVHKFTYMKRCDYGIKSNFSIAVPEPVEVPDDVVMVMQNNRIYYRDKHFFPHQPLAAQKDLWHSWRPGESYVTIDELLNRGPVYVVRKMETI